MAVPGDTCCGSRIHFSMFAGVFDRRPAMITRSATPSSGGAYADEPVRFMGAPAPAEEPVHFHERRPAAGRRP